MARAMFGGRGNSLSALAKRYGLEEKGTYVANMMDRRRVSLSPAEFRLYAEYCRHDTELCYQLFQLMSTGWYDLESCDNRGFFPIKELELIDKLLRMYTEPALKLNAIKLQQHYSEVKARKQALLDACTADKDTLMSNPKFADLLQSFGVAPPMKVSPTTKKVTFAFAKTDPGMKELLEHPDDRVQAVVAARMGVKSTLEETRTERFIAIAERNEFFPVPLRYSAARTHRLGGTDKINLQNLASRGKQGGKLKSCIEAPDDNVLIDCDSSNIEARILAWLAGQEDLVTDFANNVDVYCKMSTRIYNRDITKADKLERFVGKTVVLGCGYQTGKVKLQATLKAADPPMDLDLYECDRIVKTYRNTYYMIPRLWAQAELAIQAMHEDKVMWLGKEGVVRVEGRKGIKLPSGLYLQYPQLHKYVDDNGRDRWRYKDEKGLIDIYGGKLVENVVQALARIVVTSQLLKISKRYRCVLTVHDSIVVLAKAVESIQAREFVEACMRWVPSWAAGCPINCESGIGPNYGECK
jgi:DNA polymerase